MTLNDLRARGALALAATAIIITISVLAADIVRLGAAGGASMLAGVAFVALAAGFALYRLAPAFRYLAVSVLMAEVMALLIAMSGHPFQVDMHMAFFAALAMCGLLYDVRAILLGTVLVAVHHLGLGMFWSEMVFYGGGGLARVALHAVILVAEAVALVWLALNTQKLLGIAGEKSALADAAAEEARDRAEALNESLASRESRIAGRQAFQKAFGESVEAALAGDFSRQIDAGHPEPELARLAGDFNALLDTMDRGLSETGQVLSAMADADLSRRVTGDYEGAFARLKADTNAMAGRLAEIVMRLKQTSHALKTATGEILNGANDLARRTTKQAATIEETSAAMERLSATVGENAQRAAQALAGTKAASGLTQDGGAVMEEATSAMERITTSSAKVSDIIKMIDDIAFQTNLLALNASVEAARAGEAGKGFAVVAIEVRRLAQSAAEASSEVKALIEQSANEVDGGTRLVVQAAGVLDQIRKAVSDNSDLIVAISEVSAEQAGSIGEVLSAVRQLEEMTQHNAALAEETNAAIEQTEAQARALDAIVEVFNIDEDADEPGERVNAA